MHKPTAPNDLSQHTQRMFAQTRAWQQSEHPQNIQISNNLQKNKLSENFQQRHLSWSQQWNLSFHTAVGAEATKLWELEAIKITLDGKHKVKCFKVVINAYSKYFLHYLDFFFIYIFLISSSTPLFYVCFCFYPWQNEALHSILFIY